MIDNCFCAIIEAEKSKSISDRLANNKYLSVCPYCFGYHTGYCLKISGESVYVLINCRLDNSYYYRIATNKDLKRYRKYIRKNYVFSSKYA